MLGTVPLLFPQFGELRLQSLPTHRHENHGVIWVEGDPCGIRRSRVGCLDPRATPIFSCARSRVHCGELRQPVCFFVAGNTFVSRQPLSSYPPARSRVPSSV